MLTNLCASPRIPAFILARALLVRLVAVMVTGLGPSTMPKAMQAVKREIDNAYELSERRDCERRLRQILALYEAHA